MIIISPWIVNFRYLVYLEVFSAFGKVFFSMHLFILSVNGEVMYVYSETSLIELAGIRSGRVAISSDFFFIICCSIYLKATLWSTKEATFFRSQYSLSCAGKMSVQLISVPARMGFELELRIRWILRCSILVISMTVPSGNWSLRLLGLNSLRLWTFFVYTPIWFGELDNEAVSSVPETGGCHLISRMVREGV